jgi:hypothetical protein
LAVGQEGKLPLSTFGYPYQQLVTILTKKTEAGILKTFIAIAFKKISYPLSTISYPLLASYSTGYTSSVTGYTYPQLATLFNFKGAFLAILGKAVIFLPSSIFHIAFQFGLSMITITTSDCSSIFSNRCNL